MTLTIRFSDVAHTFIELPIQGGSGNVQRILDAYHLVNSNEKKKKQPLVLLFCLQNVVQFSRCFSTRSDFCLLWIFRWYDSVSCNNFSLFAHNWLFVYKTNLLSTKNKINPSIHRRSFQLHFFFSWILFELKSLVYLARKCYMSMTLGNFI